MTCLDNSFDKFCFEETQSYKAETDLNEYFLKMQGHSNVFEYIQEGKTRKGEIKEIM